MNRETINNDIFALSDDFFASSLNIIDSHFEFIDTNHLIQPKENYFFIHDFLNTTMNNFTNLDYSFSSKTLVKIHTDIKNLFVLYQTHKKYLKNMETIFDTKFLKKIILFKDMKEEINQIKLNPLFNDNDKEKILTINKHYRLMKDIYLDVFQDDFTVQNISVLCSLKSILNSKLYYFEKLIWIEANKSPIITRLFVSTKSVTYINSKAYIEYRLGIDLPYSEDYKYLTKCLRICK